MFTDKLVLSVQLFLTSVYLSIWFGIVLPQLISIEIINYAFCGAFGAILIFTAGLVIFLSYKWNITTQWVIILTNIALLLLVLLQLLNSSLFIWATILLSISQGLLMGIIIQNCLLLLPQKLSWSYFHLGLLGVVFTSAISVGALFVEKKELSIQNLSVSHIITISMIVFSLIISGVVASLRKSETPEDIQKDITKVVFSRSIHYVIYAASAILLIIEGMFFFWSVILYDDQQSIQVKLILPLTILTLFIFRVFLNKLTVKFSDIGWLFSFSVLLTLSLGLFYTFDISIIFIVCFGFSISILVQIIQQLGWVIWDQKIIFYIFVLGAISMMICGLYVQNHLEFIRSIKMPQTVEILSARQALIKEMASFASITLVLFGYLFIKRRSFLSS